MRYILILLVILSSSPKSKAQIVINEIMASNTSTILNDQDKGFSDWIELYNNSDEDISIGNWYISDNKDQPTKWKIPFYLSVPPKGYKLFWIDELNTSNHTNFKLKAEGETIYLANQDLVIIDSITYPQQMPDISFGRISGSIDQLRYFHYPTPLKTNPEYGNETLSFAGIPTFSVKAGLYHKPFALELLGSDDNEKIYFTLDGTIPTPESKQYLEPLNIEQNTVIRARVYSDDKLPGKIITHTYLLNESYSLPVVSLAIDPKYLWDKKIGIYVKGESNKPLEWESEKHAELWEPGNYFQRWERPINVEYFDVNGTPGFNATAGVRIHGRSSRTYAQKSLAIFLKGKYGTQYITYPLFGEGSPDKICSFLLRNGGNDWGMTMFLDGLVHTLVMDEMDIDAQLYQPAIVFINGEYWGIHNIREKINKNYIKTKYQIDTVKLDIIETDGLAKKLVASSGNFDQYNKLVEYIDNNKLSIKENYETAKEWIDINEFINYLTVQVYICNNDWPQSNMKFWKTRDEEGKWRWILYDTELSFKESSKYFNYSILESMFALNAEGYETTPCSNYLIRNLFESDEFKYEFIQRMAVYLNTVYDSEHVLIVLDSLKRNIEPEMRKSYQKWGGIKQTTYPFLRTAANHTEWEANINFVRKFIKSRPGSVRKEMLEYFNLKDTALLRLRVSDPEAGQISLMGYTLDQNKFDGYVFAGVPTRLEAIPNEGYEFVKWKGGGEEKKCTVSLVTSKKITAVFRKIE